MPLGVLGTNFQDQDHDQSVEAGALTAKKNKRKKNKRKKKLQLALGAGVLIVAGLGLRYATRTPQSQEAGSKDDHDEVKLRLNLSEQMSPLVCMGDYISLNDILKKNQKHVLGFGRFTKRWLVQQALIYDESYFVLLDENHPVWKLYGPESKDEVNRQTLIFCGKTRAMKLLLDAQVYYPLSAVEIEDEKNVCMAQYVFETYAKNGASFSTTAFAAMNPMDEEFPEKVAATMLGYDLIPKEVSNDGQYRVQVEYGLTNYKIRICAKTSGMTLDAFKQLVCFKFLKDENKFLDPKSIRFCGVTNDDTLKPRFTCTGRGSLTIPYQKTL